MKLIARCWACNRKYDITHVVRMSNVECKCGGHIITPSGKIIMMFIVKPSEAKKMRKRISV